MTSLPVLVTCKPPTTNHFHDSKFQSVSIRTHLAARLERMIASAAREAFLMVRIAHCRHHFAFHVLLARRTFGAEQFLIVDGAVVDVVFRKETAAG